MGKQIEIFGETKTLSNWTKDPRCQVCKEVLSNRLRSGWKPERAIMAPPRSGVSLENKQSATTIEWVKEPKKGEWSKYEENWLRRAWIRELDHCRKYKTVPETAEFDRCIAIELDRHPQSVRRMRLSKGWTNPTIPSSCSFTVNTKEIIDARAHVLQMETYLLKGKNHNGTKTR